MQCSSGSGNSGRLETSNIAAREDAGTPAPMALFTTGPYAGLPALAVPPPLFPIFLDRFRHQLSIITKPIGFSAR